MRDGAHVRPQTDAEKCETTTSLTVTMKRTLSGYSSQSLEAIIVRTEEDDMTDTKKAAKRTVAITGAGGGLGRETALAFAAKGDRVFGTALRPEEIADLREASGGAVSLTVCNI